MYMCVDVKCSHLSAGLSPLSITAVNKRQEGKRHETGKRNETVFCVSNATLNQEAEDESVGLGECVSGRKTSRHFLVLLSVMHLCNQNMKY